MYYVTVLGGGAAKKPLIPPDLGRGATTGINEVSHSLHMCIIAYCPHISVYNID